MVSEDCSQAGMTNYLSLPVTQEFSWIQNFSAKVGKPLENLDSSPPHTHTHKIISFGAAVSKDLSVAGRSMPFMHVTVGHSLLCIPLHGTSSGRSFPQREGFYTVFYGLVPKSYNLTSAFIFSLEARHLSSAHI